MNSKLAPSSAQDVVVVTATDDAYAMPLAVSIRSALDHFDPGRRLQLFVLDGGLSDGNRARLTNSWNDPRMIVHWVRPDLDQVSDLYVSEQVNIVTYLRLLMPIVLPERVERAIYLDADTLVRRDLGQLWDEQQAGHAVLAVPDIAAPYIDAAASLSQSKFENCSRYLCAWTPIVNYRELGLPANAQYFNGGLLVADLSHWRRENFAEPMLKCLREHREHILWWDQYALNIALAGKWRALDYRWNQGAHVYAFPNWRNSPVDRATFNGLRRDPWIVHFCSPSKPWHYFSRHPFRREFFHCLDETDWKGWRPERPEQLLQQWWAFHYRPFHAHWKARIRSAKRLIRVQRRDAA